MTKRNKIKDSLSTIVNYLHIEITANLYTVEFIVPQQRLWELLPAF